MSIFQYQGFGFASWWNGGFGSAASAQSLDEVVSTNANSVAITASYYMASGRSSDIYADPQKTESLANVATAIDDAHARGLSVLLKPHVDAVDGTARTKLAPSDPAAWFADYKQILLDNAELAEAKGVEMISLGTEIDGLTGAEYRGYWVDIINSVRAVYSGKLTYAANWDGAGQVSFWDKLDVIGIDGYVPLSQATQGSLADFVAGWTQVPIDNYFNTIFEGHSPVEYYHQLSLKTGKPVIFTELGYRSVDRAASNPGDSGMAGRADAQEQVDLYNAFFHVWSQQGDWFKGVYAWHWSPSATSPMPTDYQLEGKPAEAVVKQWYGGGTPSLDLGVKHRYLIGTSGDEALIGGIGNDTLEGVGSQWGDELAGGVGDDLIYVHNAYDKVLELDGGGTDTIRTDLAAYTLPDYVENLTYGGTGNFAGKGNWLANTILGGAGRDTLDGASGADTMKGGLGNDTYYVENPGDVVVEATNGAAGGWDLVYSNLSYELTQHVEELVLTGPGNLTGTGNGLNNRLTGTAGHNLLDGAGSTAGDTMIGGAGNDTYVVRNVRDQVIETDAYGRDAGGIDLIRTELSTFDLAKAPYVEHLTYLGTGSFRGYGNAQANQIIGGAGNDVLYSVAGEGADTLQGGAGDDTYVVRSANDRIYEVAGNGFDTIRTDLASFTLPGHVESLFYTGSGSFSGRGTTADDLLTSGAGNDTLDGWIGADTMKGGAGDDVYYVDNARDVVSEWANGGKDTVYSTVSHTLADNVEDLFLIGAGNLQGTGNALNNRLVGNAGANTLDGRGSTAGDTMVGGAGNDTYIVNSAKDRVVETEDDGRDSGGIDVIRTALSGFDLHAAPNVENMVYTGSGNFHGTGNDGANHIVAGAGNDTLDGGAGADMLQGGLGADTFVFAKGEAHGDVVLDFSKAQGDHLLFQGYAAGSTIERVVGSWVEWKIVDAADHSEEVVRFSTAPALTPEDWLFS